MKDLQKLFEECKTELDKIGIEYGNIISVTVNTRAKGRWGQTRIEKNASEWENRKYSININSDLLQDELPSVLVKGTLIHEILHTCKDGMKHTGEWRKSADLVNTYYPQYDIQRCVTAQEKACYNKYSKIKKVTTPKEYKYVLQCKNCGKQYKRMKACDSVKHPEFYRCGCCHGELERIK